MSSSAPTVRTMKEKVHEPPLLLEHYQIEGVIGQGGMGTVYKGRHISLKRDVAIKTLRVDKAATNELVTRFRKEMELIGQLDHPNVVRATDAGERNGVFFLVMEFLPGVDLGTLVTCHGALEPAQACEMARQAALGLDYIHRTLVHRDIKPSNLMLTASGLVKILDLGLARSSVRGLGDCEQTPDGCAIGTFSYMAPEQADRSRPIDGRADLYSLGCTLFKLLTGKAPFSEPEYDSVAMQLYAHRHVELSNVEGFPQIPEKLRPLLLRLMAKDPDQRFATGREVAQALAPFAAGSQPTRLLADPRETAEQWLRPLTDPLPEELSRLHAAKQNSLPPTSEIATVSARTGALPAPRMKSRWPLLLAASLLLMLLTVAVWQLAATIWHRRGSTDTQTPRVLDELPVNAFVPLLDRKTMPLGHSVESPELWQFDPVREVIDIKGPGLFLFKLGDTARAPFTLEAGVSQSPWTGKVGFFWGYHHDTEAMAAKIPGQEFAWFQVISIERRTGLKGESLYSAQRGRVALVHNEHQQIRLKSHYLAKHDLPMLDSGQIFLTVNLHRDRLGSARVGATSLENLYSDATNQSFALDAYVGGIGVVSFGNSVSFSNVRFHAKNNR